MSTTKVITVTLTPSLDRTLVTSYLAVGYHNLTQETTRLDPAGQGVNITRALYRLNVPTHGIVLIGDDATGRAYQALIQEEYFEATTIRVQGRTRSNTIILDTGNETETQIIEESAEISDKDLTHIETAVNNLILPGDIVVLAGLLPNGVSPDTYQRLTTIARQAGAEVAAVIAGEPLQRALYARPELVALTQNEMEAFFNYPVRAPEDVLGSARKLCQEGASKVLVILEGDGAVVLVSNEDAWLVELPSPEKGTTSGVWDALIAGFVMARLAKRTDREALQMGAGAAAFAASQVGSEFGSPEQILDYLDQISVEGANGLVAQAGTGLTE